MKIALDYDGTYTADPEFWNVFINTGLLYSHEITIVTMRYEHEPIEVPVPVIYTGRKAKKPYCLERDMLFDIWIDDNPEWLFVDSQ